MQKVSLIFDRLACIVHGTRWGMVTPDAIEEAKQALEWLGGPDQAGERLSLFLQVLANGNPAQLNAVRAEAVARLVDELPIEVDPKLTGAP